MKALRVVRGEQLELADVPAPAPGPREVLIRVNAAGLNRADLLQLFGRYAPPAGAPSAILGIEFAGVVEQLGSNCARATVGRRVCGLASGGAHAEYVVIPEELLVDVPASMGDVEAGATPEVFITAHDALVTQAGMRSGHSVLVHAAASGLGLAAIQLATLAGCRAFGTVRTPQKISIVDDLIKKLALRPTPRICSADTFDEEVLAGTKGAGVDIILDLVGAAYFQRNCKMLAKLGRMVCVGTMSGTTASLDLGLLLHKRLRVYGTVLRSRTLEEKVAATAAFEREVLPHVASGRIGPVIDRTFALEHAADAYGYMAENRNVGMIVLTMR